MFSSSPLLMPMIPQWCRRASGRASTRHLNSARRAASMGGCEELPDDLAVAGDRGGVHEGLAQLGAARHALRVGDEVLAHLAAGHRLALRLRLHREVAH